MKSRLRAKGGSQGGFTWVEGLFIASILLLLAAVSYPRYRGRRIGSGPNPAAFSFYATKNLTTAEGGMLTTNSDELAERGDRVGSPDLGKGRGF